MVDDEMSNYRGPCEIERSEKMRVSVWRVSNCICGKRLVPCMEMFVSALERHRELALDADTRRLLLSMSAATADRLLHHERQEAWPGHDQTRHVAET